MKKLALSLISLLLLTSFSPSALAGTCLQNCGRSATAAVLEINDYLNSSSTSGANFINSILTDGFTKVRILMPDAALAEFSYGENPGSEASISYIFIDINDNGNIYAYSPGSDIAQKTNTGLNFGIFSIPMRMRDLTRAMLADKKTLLFVESLLGPDAFTTLHFRLAKNSGNNLIWTVTFTDTTSGKSYLVKTDAVASKNHEFMVLAVR